MLRNQFACALSWDVALRRLFNRLALSQVTFPPYSLVTLAFSVPGAPLGEVRVVSSKRSISLIHTPCCLFFCWLFLVEPEVAGWIIGMLDNLSRPAQSVGQLLTEHSVELLAAGFAGAKLE